MNLQSEFPRRALVMPAAVALSLALSISTAMGNVGGFKRVQTQFIAALGDPSARSGTNAHEWGIWRVDPGPRGVQLRDWPSLDAKGGVARAGWKFDPADFWIEEYGRIMEKPDFPITPGRYVVTGDREVTTVLTVRPSGEWELAEGTLFDITHLPCRAARYKPVRPGASPGSANGNDFPVTPGGPMPKIDGCEHRDYAVVFITAVAPLDGEQ